MADSETYSEKVPRMVPLREASRLTGLSYNFLRRLCLSGEVVYIRSGKKYLLNMTRLTEYLNKGDYHE